MNYRSISGVRFCSVVVLSVLLLFGAVASTVAATQFGIEPPSTGPRVQNSSVPEDVDGNSCVDLLDITLAAGQWRQSVPPDTPADLNHNLVIDVGDLMLIARRLGWGCQSIFGVTGPNPPGARQLGREAQARWLRVGLGWAGIEPNNLDLTDPANGNWPDPSLRQLVDDGFTPILLISNNPGWAVESVPSNHTCGPLDPEDLPEFEEFMRALAERYDGDGYKDAPGTPIVIEHFEMYNEPDKLFTYAWTGCWAGDGSPTYGTRYAQMLSYAWRGVHDGNPSGKVLFGGMGAEEGTGGDFSMNGGDWLDDVLGYIQANPGNYFDWMNIHTYFAFGSRWTSWGPDIIGKVTYFRQRLAQFGLDKPMVVTETTLPTTGYSEYSWGWKHPEGELQSRYVV